VACRYGILSSRDEPKIALLDQPLAFTGVTHPHPSGLNLKSASLYGNWGRPVGAKTNSERGIALAQERYELSERRLRLQRIKGRTNWERIGLRKI
jgi:hypothetical protein